MAAHEQEGVIKYQLHHRHKNTQDYSISEINAWRSVMQRLQLIGQDDARYGGYGFGNISQRFENGGQFIISGTQTGHIPLLGKNDYCLVTAAMPELNRIDSEGACKPSSEALTHASVYLQDEKIRAVIHAHCPEIWHNTDKLQLAHTREEVAYGTPEMAQAVNLLFASETWRRCTVFTMLGHEDGVVAFGGSLQQAANAMIARLALALEIEQG